MLPIPTAVLDLLRERGWPAEYNDIPMEAREKFGEVPNSLKVEVWCLTSDYSKSRTNWFAIARDPIDRDRDDQFVIGWQTRTYSEDTYFRFWMVPDYTVIGGNGYHLGNIVRDSVDDQYKKYRKEWIHKRFDRIFPSLTMFPIGIMGLVAVIPALVAGDPALLDLLKRTPPFSLLGGILSYLLVLGLISWWLGSHQFKKAAKHDPIVHTMKMICPTVD